MKPPSSFRPGGSGRPPSDRGPYRGPGGPSSHGFSSKGGASSKGPSQRTSDRGGSAPPRGGPNGGGQGPRDQGPRDQGPRDQRPRPQGQPHQGHGAPRSATTLHVPGHAPAPRPRDGEGFKPGPKRDGQQFRHNGPHGGPHAGPRPPRPREDQPRHAPDAPKGAVWLYGHHAIAAALANPSRRLRHLLLTEEAETAISQSFKQAWPLQPERTDRARLDQLLGRDVVHQGAALLADPLPQPSLQSVLDRPGPVIVLDQVSDPRNVGAIMRSAAAFGAAAVIVQDRNAPDETGALAKAASGALEILPLLRAVNITRTLIALKAANIWCIGLDAAGSALSGPSFAGRRVALVLGSEGEGMRRLTRETCDEVVGLSIKGVVESLNVSAAAAVALYELTRP